ncbi:hypothetical protein X975_08357, partial [Stegodyphus mimosarum]
MKEPLRGTRFQTVPEILVAVDQSIQTIKKTGAATGILRLPHRWKRVVHNAGDYIEGLRDDNTHYYVQWYPLLWSLLGRCASLRPVEVELFILITPSFRKAALSS